MLRKTYNRELLYYKYFCMQIFFLQKRKQLCKKCKVICEQSASRRRDAHACSADERCLSGHPLHECGLCQSGCTDLDAIWVVDCIWVARETAFHSGATIHQRNGYFFEGGHVVYFLVFSLFHYFTSYSICQIRIWIRVGFSETVHSVR